MGGRCEFGGVSGRRGGVRCGGGRRGGRAGVSGGGERGLREWGDGSHGTGRTGPAGGTAASRGN